MTELLITAVCIVVVLVVLLPERPTTTGSRPPPTGPRPPAPPMPRSMAAGPSSGPAHTGRNEREIAVANGPAKG